jgi:hypothetical protein
MENNSRINKSVKRTGWVLVFYVKLRLQFFIGRYFDYLGGCSRAEYQQMNPLQFLI